MYFKIVYNFIIVIVLRKDTFSSVILLVFIDPFYLSLDVSLL